MDGFVGREEQLKMLEELYKAVPQSCAVYGRMRLGKTALLQKFCEFKRHIYISGSNMLPEDCLRNISEAVSRYTGTKERLEDIQDLFYLIKKHCVKKTVVILDHYSDLLEVFPDLYNHVNRFVSRDIRDTRVLFIACDSDVSVFGRFSNLIEVRPMSYLECTGFHPEYTPLQHLQAYGMVGGTPEYQEIVKGDPVESIKGCFLEQMSPLFMEAESMVNSEISVRSDSVRIMHAMASGADNLRNISSISGLPPSSCTRAIGEMENKGLVVRESSSSVQRNWICSFDSNILRFYYSVVAEARALPDFYSVDKAFVVAKGRIPGYMEGTFKTVCAEYIRMRWSATSIMKVRSNGGMVSSDVDFMASVVNPEGRKRAAFIVCRLSGEPMAMADLNKMIAKSRALKSRDKNCFMMFSGCGFTDELKAVSVPDAEVELLSLEDVYEPLPKKEASP
jgi:AAA+ ATPase superfamily predicted ATPase